MLGGAMANERERGEHTLRVEEGVVVGVHGRDVFVELGPRSQGVIDLARFPSAPETGQRYEFTLRGREEGLWALELSETRVLQGWCELELGTWVPARVVRLCPGGLELKLGELHGFLPRSESGLAKGHTLEELVGKTLTCEVLEVDPERQRATLSRKKVQQRERQSERQRLAGSLHPGQRVQGRVSRIEDFGAFVRLANGAEGMVHVSNIAWERVEHPERALRLGQTVEAVVLAVRREGKRISLGLKQCTSDPWEALEEERLVGSTLTGEVRRVLEFGAFVAVAPGVEGLLHRSQTDLSPDCSMASCVSSGEHLSVRVLELDREERRMSLSLLHESGRRLAPDEAENAREFAAREHEAGPDTSLGRLLRRALKGEPGPDLRREEAG